MNINKFMLLVLSVLSIILQSVSNAQRIRKFFRKDYTYVEETASFYKIQTSRLSWNEAKKNCELEGAMLMYPKTSEEAEVVTRLWMNGQHMIDHVWIGATDLADPGSYRTVDGVSIDDVYTDWQSGEPNNAGGNEHCIEWFRGEGSLNDNDCLKNEAFICKKKYRNTPYNMSDIDTQRTKKNFRKDYTYLDQTASYYKIHTIKKPWNDARKTCAMEGAMLMYPENSAEAEAVTRFWKNTQNIIGIVWIGVSDFVIPGAYATLDGVSVNDVYHNWQSGEPNNALVTEHCVEWYRADGRMNDNDCSRTAAFVCKKNLTSLEWNTPCNMPDIEYKCDEQLGKCYKFHQVRRNWNEAAITCNREQAYLAIINGEKEDERLVQIIADYISSEKEVENGPNSGFIWLGFENRQQEGWKTLKRKSLERSGFARWDVGEPSAGGCGAMSTNGLLHSRDCSKRYSYVCERDFEPSNYDIDESYRNVGVLNTEEVLLDTESTSK